MSDWVTFDAITNREDWDFEVELYDPDTGEATDLTTLTAASLAVRDPDTGAIALEGALGSGVTIESVTAGILLLSFAAASMRTLCGKNYEVGLVLTIGGVIKQVILGTLPVEDGVVS